MLRNAPKQSLCDIMERRPILLLLLLLLVLFFVFSFFNQHGGIGVFGLTILAIFISDFRFLCQKTLVSRFVIHFGLRILRGLAVGFRFSSKMQTGSRNFFDLSSI